MSPALKRSLRYIAILGVVAYLVANQDFQNIVRRFFDLRSIKAEASALDKDYQSMRQERQRIQKDDVYLEKLARRDLKMAKPGELDFRFQPPKPASEEKSK
ncbi:MAG: hypothetical protein GX410_01655 [Elusimicrobia bacterium]|nr:hypothetical protein [Elusimicrobiota bacterium]